MAGVARAEQFAAVAPETIAGHALTHLIISRMVNSAENLEPLVQYSIVNGCI